MSLDKNRVVYIYKDELGVPFYVGMGFMRRAYSTKGRPQSFLDKLNKAQEVLGHVLYPDIVEVYLTKEEALRLEANLIEEIGLDNLTNVSQGVLKESIRLDPVINGVKRRLKRDY